VDRYLSQSDGDRLQFLSKQIDDVQQSGIAKTLAALMAEENAKAKNMWTSLSERVERWTGSLSPKQRAQAEQYVAAVQGSLLLRTLRATFGASS
jgi:hypothetical protein